MMRRITSRCIGPQANGFTLMEVILSIVLVIGLVGGMFALYKQALNIRDRVHQEMDMWLAGRLAVDRMTDELRSAMEFRFLQMGMEGQGDQAQWICAQLPGPAAWAVRKDTENTIPPVTDVQIVGYRLGTSENEEGELVIDGLERTCQKVLTAVSVQETRATEPVDGEEDEEDAEEESAEQAEVEVVLLTPHIKYLKLRYYDGNSWQDSWTGGDLPRAVEICLGGRALGEEEDPEEYDDILFRRVVYVPGGVKGQVGGVQGGFGGRGG